MITVEGLTKGYAGSNLFTDASFSISPRERIGLVGKNGHGKSTLMRILAGIESFDAGKISIPKNYRIGYLSQEISFASETVLDEGITSLPPGDRGKRWRVEKVLEGLGFSSDKFSLHPMELSGGFQVRLMLAKVLLAEPDLLLLDEPTNYLDILSIRWMKIFLSSWPREMILVTHDRSFMDQVVTHVMGIHRRKIRKIRGNTSKYYSQIAQEEEVYEKTRINDEKKRKEIERFISRFRAKARLANLVQSRIKTLAKSAPKEKLTAEANLEFSFPEKEFFGKYILSAEDVTFGYDPQKPLIRNFSFTVMPGDRICIVGKNGAGKTTLMRLLAGDLEPDSGTIKWHPKAEKGVFVQTNLKTLSDDLSVEQEIQAAAEDKDRTFVRNICGAMLFPGKDAEKKIRVLSGGERCRVMLGKLLVKPSNILFLDEPTNHFDLESCDALLSAIDDFKGAVILVTHNEMFLHAFAEKLIVFRENDVEIFYGNYEEFLDKSGWNIEPGPSGATRKAKGPSNYDRHGYNQKLFRKLRSTLINERASAVAPLRQKEQNLSGQIEQKESDYDLLVNRLQEATFKGDGTVISDLSKKVHLISKEIDFLYEELEKVIEQIEYVEKDYQQKLEELESQRPY